MSQLLWVRKQSGFTLLEILVVVFIIGLGASLAMPRLFRKSPDTQWPAVTSELNNMLYFARQEAITSQKVYRLAFSEKKQTITVEVHKQEKTFVPAYSHYFTTQYQLPPMIHFTAVRQHKKDLLANKQQTAYCYVVPHGLVQDISVQLTREEEGKKDTIQLIVEPFLGRFYEADQ